MLRQIKIAIPALKVIQEKQEKLNRVTAHYSVQEYIYLFLCVYYADIPTYILYTRLYTWIYVYIYTLYTHTQRKKCNSVHLQIFPFWNIKLTLGKFSYICSEHFVLPSSNLKFCHFSNDQQLLWLEKIIFWFYLYELVIFLTYFKSLQVILAMFKRHNSAEN